MKSRNRTRRASTTETIDAATKQTIESLEARKMLAVSLGADGFTNVTPSGDTRTIYVSSSTGDDANDGSSPAEAVKSISKGVQLVRSGMPDHLLLKKGDTFTSGFGGWSKSGRNAQEPMLISSYGSGSERPYLKTGTEAGFQSNKAFHDVAIIGLRFEANTRNPNSPDFEGSAGKYGLHTVGPIDGLLVEDSSFSHYVYNASITGFTGFAKNVKIRRSAFTDSWTNNDKAVGFYSSNTDGLLLEENLFDHNGWNESSKAVGGMAHPSHNVYLWESTRDPVIKGNIFARGGQHGLQARGGGLIENNLFLKNPIALLVGNGSTVRAGGVVGKVSGNVFLDSRDMNGSPRGWAIELGNIKPGGGSYVRDNVIANDSQLKHTAIMLQTAGGATNAAEGVGVNDLTIEKNFIYDWYQGISIATGFKVGGSGQTGLNDLVVRDNDFQKTASSRIVYHPQAFDADEETWADNRYYNNTPDNGWFYLGGKTTSFDAWDSAVEDAPQNEQAKYADPERDIAKYAKSVGVDGSLEGFLDEARDQQKGNWRGKFMAVAANAWIRAGFTGTTPDVPKDPTPEPTPEPTPTPTPTPKPPTSTPPAQKPDDDANSAPTATLVTSDHTTAGAGVHELQVTYNDADGKINATTVGDGDLTVITPDGDKLAAAFIGIDKTYDGPTRVAKYAVAAPGGAWDSSDNGTFTVKVNANAVRDLEVAYVEAGTLGTFKAIIPAASKPDETPDPEPTPTPGADTTPPTVLWSNFDPADKTITVKFSEDVSRSLNTGDLRLKNLSNSSLITYANMKMSYDRQTNTATWTIDADLAAVTYKVMLSWSVVSDAAGNNLDGDGDGEANPDHVMYIAANEIAAVNQIATSDAAE